VPYDPGVLFDDGPIQPGERRSLQAWADTVMTVAIKCFTNDPPPPGYKACPSCGVIKLESGAQIYITADRGVFQRAGRGAELHVSLEDLTGDRRDYRLNVLGREEPEPFAAAGGG
jgi:hypothetical protein